MCEAENLIMSAEKYPCVWDIYNADYHNRDGKDLTWDQICKEVYNDWETCTDKANKCAELKKKWTNIRDYYRKEVQKTKNVPTGSAAKKSKTYVYSQLLYFLTPIFNKRDTDGSYPTEDSDCTQPQLQSENKEQNIEPEDMNHMESTVPTPTSSMFSQKRKKDVPTQILNMLQQRQNTNAKSSNTDEDDDTKFLLSFRSYMNKMNHHQKIEFQLGMLQLIKKVTIGNDPSSSQSQYTYSDNSSVSFPSPQYVRSSYRPVPQSSPSHYNIPSPSPPYVSSLQRNIYVAQHSPIYLKSQSPSAPTFHSSSQRQNEPTLC